MAGRLVDAVGIARAPLGVLLASYLLGISVFFNVGFLLLIPVVYRLQETTRQSLLYYLLPMSFGLSLPHSLVPPHPGIVATVQALEAVRLLALMIETILGGSFLGLPMALVGWYRHRAARHGEGLVEPRLGWRRGLRTIVLNRWR